MAFAKLDYDRFHTMTGTLAEVVDGLRDEEVPAHKVLAIGYDPDNTVYFAVYHK